MDLHALFKSSVDKADARYHQMKVEADKAAAEAAIVKAEAEKAKANADREQAIAAQKRAEADRDRAKAEPAGSSLPASDNDVVANIQRICKEQYPGIFEQYLCIASTGCAYTLITASSALSISNQNTKCMACCQEINKGSIIDLTPALSVCKENCVNLYQSMSK